jgi:hypothetical protein
MCPLSNGRASSKQAIAGRRPGKGLLRGHERMVPSARLHRRLQRCDLHNEVSSS